MQGSSQCQHYQRNCQVQAPCCQIFYGCKLCHDDKYMGPKSKGCKEERMQFSEVKIIKCRNCQTQQPPSTNCIQCQIEFGKYACLKCKLYENNQKKVNNIFHCDDCRMCRLGKRQSFFHCHNCGYCRAKSQKDNHKCSENLALSKCPVCLEVLKYSTKFYISLRCGHLIHNNCLEMLKCHNCPVCGMAIGEMSAQQKQFIEGEIKKTEMPKQLADKKVNVICNECLHKTLDASFHFYGVKCQKCGTYNTKMM